MARSFAKIQGFFFVISLLVFGYGYDYKDPIKTKEQIIRDIPELELRVESEIKRHGLEKVSLAIVAENELIYKRAYGADEGEQFQAASISKVVSSYGALKLVEAGRLQLDVPLSKYIDDPYFPAGSKGNDISLRMILNHTSGMSNDTSGKDRKVYAEPGKEFHYSGGGFEYLRVVIENIVKKAFDEYMEQEILAPLGMSNSRFSIIGKSGIKHVYASGGLVTTPDDLAKFFIELMNHRHIDRSFVNQMLTKSISIDKHNSWGLGIALQHGNNQDAIWHTGNNGNVWESLAFFSLKDGTGAIVMIRGKNGYKAYAHIIHSAIGGTFYGLSRVFNNSALP